MKEILSAYYGTYTATLKVKHEKREREVSFTIVAEAPNLKEEKQKEEETPVFKPIVVEKKKERPDTAADKNLPKIFC